MDKFLAQKLLVLVNDKTSMDALTIYVEDRVEKLKEYLIATDKMEEITRIQGKITELRRLLTLRDEVIQSSKG